MNLSTLSESPPRVLAVACPSCSAPLPPGAQVGSVFRCEYCGHTGVLELAHLRASPPPGPRPDYLCLKPPPELAGLRFNPPDNIAVLRAEWARTLRLAAEGSGSQYAAYFTAHWLGYASWWRGELQDRRQVLESTLNALTEPGLRAGLLCLLARDAALAHDAPQAETWLRQCPPVQDWGLVVLRRLADASHAWVTGDWPQALALLDKQLEPPQAPLARFALELKIDCLEELGRDAEALALFEAWSSKVAAEGLSLSASLQKNGLGVRTLRTYDSRLTKTRVVVLAALAVPVLLVAMVLILAKLVS
jgi:hypothetical protein